jgi:hypothetical protein
MQAVLLALEEHALGWLQPQVLDLRVRLLVARPPQTQVLAVAVVDTLELLTVLVGLEVLVL